MFLKSFTKMYIHQQKITLLNKNSIELQRKVETIRQVNK